MKKSLLILLCFICLRNSAQQTEMDSLIGFDQSKIAMDAHKLNFDGEEFKLFVKNAQREFLQRKYFPKNEESTSKYGSGHTNVFPCLWEDFEAYPIGVVVSTAGWTATQGLGSGYICTGTVAMTNNTSAVTVSYTPFNDDICGAIGTSPLGGSKVVMINSTKQLIGKIVQPLHISSSNKIFTYAYKAALSNAVHGCCDDAFLMFRFTDQSGNLISSISRTVVLGTPSCVTTNTSNLAASTASPGYHYTPNWEVTTVNLSAYVNSSVTAEVIAGSCSTGLHKGYMYFDAVCSDGGVIVNDQSFVSLPASYTSCVTNATLNALPGFQTYQWDGPSGSGITSYTNPVLTTSVSGTYTLSMVSGSTNLVRTLNLYTTQTYTPGISGSSTLCSGNSVSLQVTGTNISTYTWSSSSTLQAISVSPSITTTYTVNTRDIYSCPSSATHSVTVYPTPSVTISGSGSPSLICRGWTYTLTANSTAGTTLFWSPTGSNSPVIAVSPSVTTTYTAVVTTTDGCSQSSTFPLLVLPSPQLQTTIGSQAFCPGGSTTITATGLSGNTYKWSTGATVATISVSPQVTTVYQVTATTTSGCTDSVSNIITVYPLPQIQMVASHSEICMGQTATFGLIGTNIAVVLWNTGVNSPSILVSPTLNSVYSASATSINGCVSSASASLMVNALPDPLIIASTASICAGNTVTLSVTGTNLVGYNWSNNQTSLMVVVSPTINSVYSVTVTNNKGCLADTNFQIIVIDCDTLITATPKMFLEDGRILVFPNPSEEGAFEIKGKYSGTYLLLNELGQLIQEIYLRPENNFSIKVTNLPGGVYFIKGEGSQEKIIVR